MSRGELRLEMAMSNNLRLPKMASGTGLIFSLALSVLGCSDGNSGVEDAGMGDTDAGTPDTGTPDAGTADAGPGPSPLPNQVDHVNPFIGTDDSDSPFPVPGGAGGSTFPGATVPFGM